MAYEPNPGDIIFLEFNPQAGHEQAGRRPAIVASNNSFHKYTNGLALVCPITNTLTPFPLHIPLDDRTKTTGVIMVEQVKSLDLNARHAEFREAAPQELLEQALRLLRLTLG